MKHKVLAIGVQNLPKKYGLSWEKALNEQVNIADYDFVLINFSSLPYEKDLARKLNGIFNLQKLVDVLRGGIKLFVFIQNVDFELLLTFLGIDLRQIFSTLGVNCSVNLLI